MTADGRVLRVRWCSACGTWYGANYWPADAAEEDRKRHTCQHCCRPCEFLDHWPNRHGESRALVAVGAGAGEVWQREGPSAGEFESCSAAVQARAATEVPTRWRPALGPAQQELGL